MNKRTAIFSFLVVLFFIQGAGSIPLFGYWSHSNNPSLLEEEIVTRLESMECLVTPKIEDDVLDQVKRFIGKRKDHALELLQRTEMYFPLIDKIFGEYDLPADLKFLTIVESSLVLNAKSNAGAAGLWQLMPSTARILDLRVDDKVDQRLDPVLSTHAAARYFKTLYGMFNDWSLVLAAYNCGEYKIKGILQATGATDFWSIKKLLPRQTQLFVPAFIGASYMMQYHPEHDIIVDPELIDVTKLTFARTFKEVHLRDLYRKTAITKETFLKYNPSYRKGIIPAHKNGYYVSLPDSLMVEFVDYYTYNNQKNKGMSEAQIMLGNSDLPVEILSFSRPFIFAPDAIAIQKVEYVQIPFDFSMKQNELPQAPVMEQASRYIHHVVRNRESLLQIAEDYKVDLESLIKWNELDRFQNLRAGMVLRIKA